MNKSTEILMAARDIIKDERNWCHEYFAKNEQGEGESSLSEAATQFCMIGALNRASYKITGDDSLLNDPYMDAENFIREMLYKDTGKCSIQQFNDDPRTTHKDVLNIYNKSIEKSLSKGGIDE